MNSKKLKDKVQEYFWNFTLDSQQTIFDFVYRRLKRMAEKNNLQGQKISLMENEIKDLEKELSLMEVKLKDSISKNDTLAKELYTQNFNHSIGLNELRTSLRSSMKSQTESIVALRDENEKLRNQLNNTSEERLIKIVKQREQRIAELEIKLIASEDYITKMPPGFYDVVNTINENERFKKVIAHSADRIVELEMQLKSKELVIAELQKQLHEKLLQGEKVERLENIIAHQREVIHATVQTYNKVNAKLNEFRRILK